MKTPKIFKNEDGISISPLTLLSAVILVVSGCGLTLLSYAAVLLPHELAHAYVSERLGYRVRRMRILPYGIALSGDYMYFKPADEIKIALAGPAVNLVMFASFAALWWFFPAVYSATQYIAFAALFTAFVNLLPILPLDGGRALRAFLLCFASEKVSCVAMRIIGLFAGAAAVASAIFLLVSGYNHTFALLGLFVLISLFYPADDSVYGRIYAMNDMRFRLHGGLPVCRIMVHCGSTLSDLFKMLRPDRYTCFTVCDDAGRRMFELDELRLEELIAQFNCSDTVISVANFPMM